MKPATSEVCPDCFHGEVGFGDDIDFCQRCHGSGFVAHVPRWEPDTREEARGER